MEATAEIFLPARSKSSETTSGRFRLPIICPKFSRSCLQLPSCGLLSLEPVSEHASHSSWEHEYQCTNLSSSVKLGTNDMTSWNSVHVDGNYAPAVQTYEVGKAIQIPFSSFFVYIFFMSPIPPILIVPFPPCLPLFVVIDMNSTAL
jgi:hypothetical protein